MRKHKVLFFCEAVSMAHVVRNLVLAKTLDKKKYDIFFACGKSYKNIIEKENYKVNEVYSISNQEFNKKLYYGKVLYDKKTIRRYIKDELKILKKIKPDICVGDFRLTLGISCAELKIPYINVINSYWSPYSENYKNYYPSYETIYKKIFGYKITELFFKYLFLRLIMQKLIKPFQEECIKNNLIPPKTLREMYCYADYVLYAEPSSIGVVKNIPKNHNYIGGIHWQPDIKLPESLMKIPENKIKIYASNSSTGKFSEKELSYFDDDVFVIFASGKEKISIPKTKNRMSFDFLPALEILKKVDIAVVNGSLPSFQAFSKAVPVIIMPHNMDQYLFGKIIQGKKIGIMIRKDQFNKESLKNTINELCKNPVYKENLKKISKKMKEDNIGENFNSFLREILKKKINI